MIAKEIRHIINMASSPYVCECRSSSKCTCTSVCLGYIQYVRFSYIAFAHLCQFRSSLVDRIVGNHSTSSDEHASFRYRQRQTDLWRSKACHSRIDLEETNEHFRRWWWRKWKHIWTMPKWSTMKIVFSIWPINTNLVGDSCRTLSLRTGECRQTKTNWFFSFLFESLNSASHFSRWASLVGCFVFLDIRSIRMVFSCIGIRRACFLFFSWRRSSSRRNSLIIDFDSFASWTTRAQRWTRLYLDEFFRQTSEYNQWKWTDDEWWSSSIA